MRRGLIVGESVNPVTVMLFAALHEGFCRFGLAYCFAQWVVDERLFRSGDAHRAALRTPAQHNQADYPNYGNYQAGAGR
jgi:hypothetical protein